MSVAYNIAESQPAKRRHRKTAIERLAHAISRGVTVNTYVVGPHSIAELIAPFALLPYEVFMTVSLNGRHKVMPHGVRVVSIGIVNSSLVHPRELMAPLITDRAAAFVMAHNHPSGELDPSNEDFSITRKMVQIGEMHGIPLVDHVIVGTGGFYSMKQRDEHLWRQISVDRATI